MTYPVSPLVLLVLAAGLAVFARRRWLRGVAIAGVLLGYLGCTSIVANALAAWVEARATRAGDACDRLDGIVVLAGGLQRAPRDAQDALALNAETQQRLLNFAERDDPALPLLLSGGGGHAVSEAAAMQAFLHRIAPARRVAMLETASLDTWTNAVETARLWPPPRRIALATSAIHLPRARLAFEAQGFSVCPWPVNRAYYASRGIAAWLPHSSAARRTEAVLHEAGGWLVYAWRRRFG